MSITEKSLVELLNVKKFHEKLSAYINKVTLALMYRNINEERFFPDPSETDNILFRMSVIKDFNTINRVVREKDVLNGEIPSSDLLFPYMQNADLINYAFDLLREKLREAYLQSEHPDHFDPLELPETNPIRIIAAVFDLTRALFLNTSYKIKYHDKDSVETSISALKSHFRALDSILNDNTVRIVDTALKRKIFRRIFGEMINQEESRISPTQIARIFEQFLKKEVDMAAEILKAVKESIIADFVHSEMIKDEIF